MECCGKLTGDDLGEQALAQARRTDEQHMRKGDVVAIALPIGSIIKVSINRRAELSDCPRLTNHVVNCYGASLFEVVMWL